jgi:poly(A) polymerase
VTSIAGAPFLSAPGLQHLMAVLNPSTGRGETRIVGGAVRNTLIGRPVTDIDLATVFPPEETTRRAEGAGLHVVPTGLRFGTVTVVAQGEAHEVTSLRRDVATDGRWAQVAFGTDWGEDAARRDLTINALYADADGTLYDPLGALPDVLTRRVRFIGDADQRIREDHLRALRFFRFHAQYADGAIDASGFRASIRARALLPRLSPERIRQELVKLVKAPRAAETLALLAETGILSDMVGVPALGRFARLTTIEQRAGLDPDATRRLAALAARVEEDALRLAAALRLSNREGAALEAVGRTARRLARDPRVEHARRVLHAVGPHYCDAVLVGWAEAGAFADDAAFARLLALPEVDPVPPFPLRGADLLAFGVSPGPQVGVALAALEQLWIEGDFRASRETLLAAAQAQLRR